MSLMPTMAFYDFWLSGSKSATKPSPAPPRSREDFCPALALLTRERQLARAANPIQMHPLGPPSVSNYISLAQMGGSASSCRRPAKRQIRALTDTKVTTIPAPLAPLGR